MALGRLLETLKLHWCSMCWGSSNQRISPCLQAFLCWKKAQKAVMKKANQKPPRLWKLDLTCRFSWTFYLFPPFPTFFFVKSAICNQPTNANKWPSTPRDMSEIVGVRYTTMFGDPGREFLQSSLVEVKTGLTHPGKGVGGVINEDIFL